VGGIAAVVLVAVLGAGIGIGAALWSGGSASSSAAPALAHPNARLGGSFASGGESRRSVSVNVYSNVDHYVGTKVDCTTGPEPRVYVMAVDNDQRGTIASRPAIDWTGTHPDLYTTYEWEKSVAWGHIGSRLVTEIGVGAAHGTYDNHYDGAKVMKATVSCTDDKDAAWVIFG